jgi:hypothetical protein
MPKLFLDVKNENLVVDDEGQNFADQAAAVRSAIEAAVDIAKDDFPAGRTDETVVQVRGEDGRVVATVSLSLRVTQTG